MTVMLGAPERRRKQRATLPIIDSAGNLTDIGGSNGWLDFKEGTRVEKSARAQAAGADRSPNQRAGRAVQGLVGRGVARKDRGLERRFLENYGARGTMG